MGKKTATEKIYTYETNDSVSLFYSITESMYLGTGFNFMFDELKLPAKFVKFYKYASKACEVLNLLMICSQWGAFFTQHDLDMTYKSKLWMFGPGTETIKELSFTLVVVLRGMFTDDEIEKNMIKKTWRYVYALKFLINGLYFSMGIVGGYVALTTSESFTTVIPVWPNVEDRSLAASVGRIAHYCAWYFFIQRPIAIYLIILALSIAVQHQYRMLCHYFRGLTSIFDGDGSHEENEQKYEDAVKYGVKMHSLTLWCAEQTQVTIGVAITFQLVANVITLVMLMMQWMFMEHTFGNCLNIVIFMSLTFTCTGIIIWNAGDITFEAADLPTAMFHSGWHNCRGERSAKIRKLLTIAIQQAQLVKFAYSVFSVMF